MGICHHPFLVHTQQQIPLCMMRDLEIAGCTFEPRMQKWILIAGQVAKPIASHHCWAFKLTLKKAAETNYNIKKEKDLGVDQVCVSESQDCGEHTRAYRTIKELGVERALLLLFSCFWPGVTDLTGVPRAQQHEVR